MRSQLKDNTLTLYLEGKIGVGNAQSIQDELMEEIAAHPGADLVLDASDLVYISSTGMRVLMALFKEVGNPVPIVNANPEVYDVLDLTGFTTLTTVSRKLREVSLEGCEIVGRGASSTVYRIDEETIVKVFDSAIGLDRIERERENAKAAFINGLPTAIPFDTVRCGDGYGTVYELIEPVTLSKFMVDNPEKAQEYRVKYARMMKDMHQVTVPDTFESVSALYKRWIRSLNAYLSEEEICALVRYIDAIPMRDTMVHGDCHVGNILVQQGELVLIDMADIGRGHPFFDIASENFHYKLKLVEPLRPIISRSVLGFVPENDDFANTIWDTLVQTYFEPQSEDGLRTINDIAHGGGLLRLVALCAKHAQLADDVKQAAIDDARQSFFPRIEEYTETLGMLDRYFHAS